MNRYFNLSWTKASCRNTASLCGKCDVRRQPLTDFVVLFKPNPDGGTFTSSQGTEFAGRSCARRRRKVSLLVMALAGVPRDATRRDPARHDDCPERDPAGQRRAGRLVSRHAAICDVLRDRPRRMPSSFNFALGKEQPRRAARSRAWNVQRESEPDGIAITTADDAELDGIAARMSRLEPARRSPLMRAQFLRSTRHPRSTLQNVLAAAAAGRHFVCLVPISGRRIPRV